MSARELLPEHIDALTAQVLRPGEVSRPDVRLIVLGERRYVLKDYARNSTWFKRAMGAYLVVREMSALTRAQGIDGVPTLGPSAGPFAVVTEYLDTQSVLEAPAEMMTEGFFERLRGAVESLHTRGVAHGDLKNLSNILVSADGQPFLVDFTSAFTTGSNPIAALIFPLLCEDDLKAILKLKQRRAPQLLSEADEQTLVHRSRAERFFRWARQYVRRLVKWLSRGEPEAQ